MDLFLLANGLGYLRAGSNLLQRNLSVPVMNRPLYMHSDASPFPHYAVAFWRGQ
jgi:hypothetical protein